MKQLEIEHARNLDIESREQQSSWTTGLLKWKQTSDQTGFNPHVLTQCIFPRDFKAHQKGQVPFWVHNCEQFLTHGISELFNESKLSQSAICITQSVRRPIYRQVIASAFAALEDNSVSNHVFSWDTSRYED
jgi:hypothetical protein